MDKRAARYDGHADFYDELFGWYAAPGDSPGSDLIALLGHPSDGGWCLDLACGTGFAGVAAATAGWQVGGVDVSADQLRFAARRLAWVVRGDAHQLPFKSSYIPEAVGMFVHTDVDDFSMVVGEVARVLRPGGRFVCVGVHPCFVGPHIDSVVRGDELAIVAGYRNTGWFPPEVFDTDRFGQGIRRRVGSAHLTLATFVRCFLDAGLVFHEFRESGEGLIPWRIGVIALKPSEG